MIEYAKENCEAIGLVQQAIDDVAGTECDVPSTCCDAPTYREPYPLVRTIAHLEQKRGRSICRSTGYDSADG